MKAISILPAALFASALLAPATVYALQPVTNFGGTWETGDRNNSYADGTRAINDGRWADAEAIFAKIAAEHGDRADGALYWKAYAENKEGNAARAIETCATLRHNYASSRYINDCEALRIEIQGPAFHVEVPPVPPVPPAPPISPANADARSGQTVSNPDEDLKLLALNALMQQNEARALPAIKQILDGNGSERLKERALFVLANSDSPEAQNLIRQIARGITHGQPNPALQAMQINAVRMYAAIKGKQSEATLADIYQHTTDEAVKRAVLQSYLVTGSPDKLLEAARTEQNPVLTKAAVQSLGAMAAASALSQLYHDSKDMQVKSAILGSLVAAGPKGAEVLSEIAKTEKNPELRRKAIRNLGATGGPSAAPALVSSYQSSPDLESKRAAIDGLFISGDAHDLVALARAEKNPELKQQIVSKLSIMHNKEATDYMMEILNK